MRGWVGFGCALLAGVVVGGAQIRAAQSTAPEAKPTALKLEVVAEGLERPWGMQFLSADRFLVTERPGRLRIVGKDGTVSPPVGGVPDVIAQGQGGLLDVALSRDFKSSLLIYMSFSETRGEGRNGTSVLRARLVEDERGSHLEQAEVIFRQQPSVQSNHHFGSRIAQAGDGSLFVTLGERATQRDQAQNGANHLGKVVRLKADGTPWMKNPAQPGWDTSVWSIGHRNPQGAAIDPATGALWLIEHGAQGGDELNSPQRGRNYGWPVITYGRDYSGVKIGEGVAKAGMEQPVYYWDPSIAVSGLTFYQGSLFPSWVGNLLVGSLKGGFIERLVLQNGAVVARERLTLEIGQRVRDVREGPDGAIYVLTDDVHGRLLRVVPAEVATP